MSDSSKRGVSRRGFVVGSALSAMAAGVAAALGGCSKSSSDDGKDGKPQVITDNSKIISVTDDYKYKSFDMKPVATWMLPLGTLLFHSDGPYCAAMMAPESARHVNTLGVLSLELGECGLQAFHIVISAAQARLGLAGSARQPHAVFPAPISPSSPAIAR